MHKCWEDIYDHSEHSHRDPVANVVIYSSIAFFFGFVALAFGVALYVLMDSPCLLSWDGNDTILASQAKIMDSCHVVIPFALSICAICISSIGIAAGEVHVPLLYSIFNGTGFCGIFFELYSFCSLITQVVDRKSTLDTIQLALGAVAVAAHGIVFISLVVAVRYGWMVNYHFSRQDMMLYVERLQNEKAVKDGKGEIDNKLNLKVIEINIPDEDVKVKGFQRALANIQGLDAEARKEQKKQATKSVGLPSMFNDGYRPPNF
jgi:hypothetical protein